MGSSQFFGAAEIGYFVAMMVYIGYFVFRSASAGKAATVVTSVSFASQTAAILLRWFESYQMGIGRAPLTNLYESLEFFVWCLILGYLIIEFKYKTRSFGAFITPIAGLTLGFIDLTAMKTTIEPLVPALQSNWLLAHVTMAFISYSAFGLSFGAAMMYLILKTDDRKGSAYWFWTITAGIFVSVLVAMLADYLNYHILHTPVADAKDALLGSTFRNKSSSIRLLSYLAAAVFTGIVWRYGGVLKRTFTYFGVSAELLDQLNYNLIALGFPIFTLGGLIFGAVWADQAWGVYWSWDPKETWSLITWLSYAFYLHARFIKGWRGTKVAVVAVVAFVTVVFTYLGVNIFLSGLHSYGEMP
ncbi:MAG: c-type cytochrome biogenesis protein CcsB [Nitrospirae bacterium]|nr:c-type cytochrome biogenesis protein CcsB [Nitrospirota bacterium]MBF0535366.1 c-type cytochrome biogenesis protein CcsB [Nitrospirota bacterium]MBF0616886.1 c-type cytochrome biogenesis protein CcsB [Nitrospirota bacterium]